MATATGSAITRSLAAVPAYNWDRYDFGPGPRVFDRLNQGPFSQYVQDATIPTDEVVMATTASALNIPNSGRGLITYVTADMGLGLDPGYPLPGKSGRRSWFCQLVSHGRA